MLSLLDVSFYAPFNRYSSLADIFQLIQWVHVFFECLGSHSGWFRSWSMMGRKCEYWLPRTFNKSWVRFLLRSSWYIRWTLSNVRKCNWLSGIGQGPNQPATEGDKCQCITEKRTPHWTLPSSNRIPHQWVDLLKLKCDDRLKLTNFAMWNSPYTLWKVDRSLSLRSANRAGDVDAPSLWSRPPANRGAEPRQEHRETGAQTAAGKTVEETGKARAPKEAKTWENMHKNHSCSTYETAPKHTAGQKTIR